MIRQPSLQALWARAQARKLLPTPVRTRDDQVVVLGDPPGEAGQLEQDVLLQPSSGMEVRILNSALFLSRVS